LKPQGPALPVQELLYLLSSYPRKMNGWPPSGAKVKNEWSCTSAPCIYFHDIDRENFTFIGQPCVLKWCWFLRRAVGVRGALRAPFAYPQRLKCKRVRSVNTGFDWSPHAHLFCRETLCSHLWIGMWRWAIFFFNCVTVFMILCLFHPVIFQQNRVGKHVKQIRCGACGRN
jgi:hypothetical protein